MRNTSYEPLVEEDEGEGADALQTFEDFSQQPVTGVPIARPISQGDGSFVAPGAPGGVAGLEGSAVTRVINIPDYPSASAKWQSPQVTQTFLAVLLVSVALMVYFFPLTIIFGVGLPGFIASVIGIILASLKLCECCQSEMLEANVNLVNILAWVCIGFDAAAVLLFTLILHVATHDAEVTFRVTTKDYIAFIILIGLPLLHLGACWMAKNTAKELRILMRPIRSGMVVMT